MYKGLSKAAFLCLLVGILSNAAPALAHHRQCARWGNNLRGGFVCYSSFGQRGAIWNNGPVNVSLPSNCTWNPTGGRGWSRVDYWCRDNDNTGEDDE